MSLHPIGAVGSLVLEAVGWLVDRLRAFAWRDLEGRHHEFRHVPIDIVEGNGAERWLRLDHVRRVVPDLPLFPSLRHRHPRGLRRDDDGGVERIEARTLRRELTQAQALRTRRFLVWLDRVVIDPAERRERMRSPS
ncbi:hypothetical protein [Rubrivivax gelatinosus]|uniref:Uncharacterized protein n=1 Tax=Rubrivivax gelatinosus TaxID=28068 RepID=A0A4R2MH00_RUBGE|nr:hypothetical protein [Rubrivivax gelatinosus]MBK1689232.1 hypothetical protein [Rubrivivax gelatinosus]TCP02046.1 hypothetical protein EV684_10751 [Rubrivivax gelatinosus]